MWHEQRPSHEECWRAKQARGVSGMKKEAFSYLSLAASPLLVPLSQMWDVFQAKQARGAWDEKRGIISQLNSCSFTLACAAAYESQVEDYIAFKSSSTNDPLYSSKLWRRENRMCSFLLRLKRLHVELVSWVPAWIK